MKFIKWRVEERRLNFVNKIMAKENSNITKKLIMSEVLLEDLQKVTIKGLAYECKSVSEEISITEHVTYSTLLNHIEGDLNSLYVCIC